MSTRVIDFGLSTREEITREDDGYAPLRARIMAAHQSGDHDRLKVLQREYRNRRLPGRTVTHAAASRRVSPTRKGPGADPARLIAGYLVTWSTARTLASLKSPDIHLSRYEPHAFDEQLRTLDPTTIPLLFKHDETLEVGRFRSIVADDVGLRVFAEVDVAYRDLCMRAIEVGDVRGFSVHAENSSSHTRREGSPPVVVVERARLLEGSLATVPGDTRAVIVSVGGHAPAWRQVEASMVTA